MSQNIPLTIGTKVDLWNKFMKEVKLGRYAGPFDKPPFPYYMQSPVGLVPKDNGKQFRLIFHLSYDFGNEDAKKSFNHHTPQEKCKVKYNDLDHLINNALNWIQSRHVTQGLYFSTSDLKKCFPSASQKTRRLPFSDEGSPSNYWQDTVVF